MMHATWISYGQNLWRGFMQVCSLEFNYICRKLECTYCMMKTASSVCSTNKIKTSPVCVLHTTCEEISIKTHLSVTGYAAVDKPHIWIDDPFQPPRGYLL